MDLNEATECFTVVPASAELQLTVSHYFRPDFVTSEEMKQQIVADYLLDAKLRMPYKVCAQSMPAPPGQKSKLHKYFRYDCPLHYATAIRDTARLVSRPAVRSNGLSTSP